MQINLLAGSSPHIKNTTKTNKIMLDVLIALTPAALASIYFFGIDALLVIIVTSLSCIGSEFIFNKILKKESTLSDLSALVTGVLLAFNLPPEIPLWIAIIGGIFAIIVAKQLFGGLGHNFINPALAARAFMMASWPVEMTSWKNPSSKLDSVTSATPLELIKSNGTSGDTLPNIMDLFTGNVGGCIGETSAFALLIGAAYLIIKKVISIDIPISYIGTVALLTWILGGEVLFSGNFIYHIFAGGLILGAFFMATDYTTSPVTKNGRIIMGVGCGLLTVIIRLYGGYPEGVSYSILLMNLVVPLIDRYLIPKSFGEVKKHA
ncbi:MAG: RnfABCDGE type electron transport complex subunit D [Clostridiales bacterium]